MKERKLKEMAITIPEKKTVVLEEYGVTVNKYLTVAQVQQIAEATMKFHTWAERQQNIDMLTLVHATDMTVEELEKHSHDELVQSGLIDKVENNIENFWDIGYALEYHESTQRALSQILAEINKFMDTPVAKNAVQKFARKVMNNADNNEH